MASSSGTLFKYLKNSITPNQEIPFDHKGQGSIKRKTDASKDMDTSKRRKLSLSALRSKQCVASSSDNNPKPNDFSEASAVDPVNAIKNYEEEKEFLHNEKEGIKMGNNGKPSIDMPDKSNDKAELPHHIPMKTYSRLKKSTQNAVFNTIQKEGTELVNALEIHQGNRAASPPSPDESSSENVHIVVMLDESSMESNTSCEVFVKQRSSEAMILADSEEEVTIEKPPSESKGAELNASRRSGRSRVPVKRFTIDCSDDEDKKTHNKSKGTPKRKPPKAVADNDDIILIEDKPPPRKSVSTVLGKGKKTSDVVPRLNSTAMMQEAKKLMDVASGKQSVSSFNNQVNVTSTTKSPSVKLTTVWPVKSHVGMFRGAIMYPLLSVVMRKTPAVDVTLPDDTVFRYTLDDKPFFTKTKASTRCYDACVEEVSKSHSSVDIEQMIEGYRNVSRCDSSLPPQEVTFSEQRPWTDLYCPDSYKEYIGNNSSMKQLYRWLDGWRTKLLNEKKKGRRNRKNRSWSSSDSDSDFVDGEEVAWLNNVVLLTGPTGSGKSGAIATCSKQLGYKVIELNSSSERSGKSVAELLTEASQSHSVTGKSGAADFTKILADINARNSNKKPEARRGLDHFFSQKGGEKPRAIDVDKSKKRKKEKSKLAAVEDTTARSDDNTASHSKVDKMSLIVLEEIDLVFEEDRGFHAGIVALTQVARRPIILTSNDQNIKLPTDAQFMVLPFSPPKVESVLSHMNALSLSHNHFLPLYPTTQFIQHTNSNLLKTVSNLEFLNTSAKSCEVSEIDITSHYLGIPCNDGVYQRVFLEQTQTLKLDFVSRNLDKLLKKRGHMECDSTNKRALLEQVICRDTFITLDMMSEEPRIPLALFQLYPPQFSTSLTETAGQCDSHSELYHDRVAVEDALLSCLDTQQLSRSNTRLNEYKPADKKRYTDVKTVQCGVGKSISGISLLSRGVMDELSTLRQICRTETIKEESGLKRRFKHYLDMKVPRPYRESLSDQWLGS